jgi:hypothetical protein
MSLKINIVKKQNTLFVLSDGSSYSEAVISQKNYRDYILLNQDINNHFFWLNINKKSNNLEKLNIFTISNKIINK